MDFWHSKICGKNYTIASATLINACFGYKIFFKKTGRWQLASFLIRQNILNQ